MNTDLFAEPSYVSHRVNLFEVIYERQQAEAKQRSIPITITLLDGKTISGMSGVTTPIQMAESIGISFAKSCIIARVNGTIWDLNRPFESDSTLEFIKFKSPEGQKVFWHSSAHMLGEALEYRFSQGRLCIGPPLESGGFYSDISLPDDQLVVPDDFKDLEAFISKVIKEKQPFQRIVLTKPEALEMFKFNPFKIEIITDKIPDGELCTAYRCGPLIDLCRGPHIPHTGCAKAFRIHKSSSAYWKGESDQPSLQRVYGISFQTSKELREWEDLQRMAAERDHRKIGREQRLFFFNELSPGSCFFLPHGTRIYNSLMDLMRRQYRKRGYAEVITPNVYNADLWKTSGHYAHYKERMFSFESDEKEFALKPMNCPGHCLMFDHEPRSYKDLPIRYADFGVLHRNEPAGALSGLTRVRRFQQDDAHIFCRTDQILQEVSACLSMLKECFAIFGFKFRLALSTRPEKAMGDEAIWDEAEDALEAALVQFAGDGWAHNRGGGAFYGPNIDIEVTDALQRHHQCGTIQLDFQMPVKFDLRYDEDAGFKPRPVLIHRSILGSVERFMASMTEHIGGNWPFWLSPRQCIVIPIADKFGDYASVVCRRIHDAGFFCDVDRSRLQFKKKIALAASSSLNANADKGAMVTRYNFILIVGAEEVHEGTADVRTPSQASRGKMAIDTIIALFEHLRDTYAREDDAPAAMLSQLS